jgi:transcription elongation factor GreA
MDRVPLTRAGYEKLRAEINQLKMVERAKNIKDIEEARAHGDLSENAEYSAAKEKQGLINGRIVDLDNILSLAEVIEPSSVQNKDRVVFGATVTLYDNDASQEVTYQIVGDYESDIKENRLAISSPIARGIIGRREGDEVRITTPKGVRILEVMKIEYL